MPPDTARCRPVLGDGDDDQNHEESGPVASSTSDATVRGRGWGSRMPAFRSVVSVLVRSLMPPISG
jgi:hypothetical protein